MSHITEHRKQFVYSLLFVLFGVALNIIGAKLALTLSLPVFLDSLGTLLTAAICGVIPGIIVGFASNCLNSISDPITLYYGILSVLMAVYAAWAARRGVFRSIGRTLVSVLIFSFIGGILGTLMSWALYGLDIGTGISAPLAIFILNSTGLSRFWSQFIADALIDLLDKLITVLLCFIVIAAVPDRILFLFPYGQFLCRDVQLRERETPISRLRKSIKYSIKYKIATMIIITALILGSLSISISFVIYKDTMNARYIQTGETASQLACRLVDGDKVEQYMQNGFSGEYWLIERQLYQLRDAMPDIKYLYVYQICDDGCHVVFDLDTDDTEGDPAGSVREFDITFKPYLPDLLAGRAIKPVISNDQYGWLLTVYRQIFDSQGRCVAYAAADIPMSSVIADRYVFAIRIFALLFGASIIIIAFALWYSEDKLVKPLNQLTLATEKFAYDTTESRLSNIDTIRELHISTGDEIESLYSAINKTTGDIANYVAEINLQKNEIVEKAEVISRLQINMIYAFAEMVESRDENTGCHIRRTAGYVHVIAQELFHRGMFPGQLDAEIVDEMTRAAPLHDVGKIKIPDYILNKPGKLTDEEFEIIKTHTTAGRDILNQVHMGIDGENTLTMATQMAACHHERWDGKGYPAGLSGDAIPLCARIMSVADVFDALLSKRSYKEPFGYDDAVVIIRDGAGTQFDPNIVKVFLEISDDLKQI